MNTLNTEKKDFRLPSYHEIPDVGLYLDQCAKYINSYLTDFPDMNVTPSMISNYAKQKLINRISKKTYTRDQIAVLILINLIKSIISIDNIRLLLETVTEGKESAEDIYEFFRSALTISYAKLFGGSGEIRNSFIPAHQQEILRLIAEGTAHKMYLEQFFSVLSEKKE